ncbi:hypothetical protein SAMN04489860_1405 [Paraoerskovia marina]|uniref:GyrI-like small molecule binding domain-containing protein n=1 Tax=Paraoerskovia marina TaxID=545619 RepID=A0A1H1RNB9_9CELL|nr:GyrI-like domain-containing protein [Paraoerskovia marina]SDS37287.1 hypothetical protein SAMN04489860_1405 [Paraoerskovia marina]
MTETVDFKKGDELRAPRGDFRLLDVPPTRYLMIDGGGDPNTSSRYADALATLYPVGYALKFASKDELGRNYVVPPLEGLWWADDMTTFTTARDKSRWRWTMMLLVPRWVPDAMVTDVVQRVRDRKAPPRIDELRWETLAEGRVVQTLHVGPFDDEGPVLARMHDEFMPGQGLRPRGRHHEIYLGDPRRVAPERMRTVLRQPVEPV